MGEDESDVDAEEEYNEDDVESDTDTVHTTDTVQTTDTIDSLHENVKFPEEKSEELESAAKSKPKIDLRDLVKQDLKGIITSVDYFDEEKYEGGKRLKKKKKKSDEKPTSKTSESQADLEPNKLELTEEISNSSSDTKQKSSPETTEEADLAESSSKRKITSDTKSSPKKVKTTSATFKVSKKLISLPQNFQ